ncbi:MAG: hypothetical protein AB7F90_13810 [Nitrospirales bacterium]
MASSRAFSLNQVLDLSSPIRTIRSFLVTAENRVLPSTRSGTHDILETRLFYDYARLVRSLTA